VFSDKFFEWHGGTILLAAITILLAALNTKWPRILRIDKRILLFLLISGNTADYLTTMLVVSRWGIDAETTNFLRELMRLGWGWFTIFKLIVLTGCFAILVFISRLLAFLVPILLAGSIVFFLFAIHNLLI